MIKTTIDTKYFLNEDWWFICRSIQDVLEEYNKVWEEYYNNLPKSHYKKSSMFLTIEEVFKKQTLRDVKEKIEKENYKTIKFIIDKNRFSIEYSYDPFVSITETIESQLNKPSLN